MNIFLLPGRFPPHLILGVIAVIFGAILLLSGYRLFKSLISLTGFFLGLWFGSALASSMDMEGIARLIIGIVAGIFFGAISFFFYKIGIFVIGTFAGFFLSGIALDLLSINYPPIILAIPAVLFGLLSVFLQRFLIILATSSIGSSAFLLGLFFAGVRWYTLPPLFERFGPSPSFHGDWLFAILWLILALFGVLFQLRFS